MGEAESWYGLCFGCPRLYSASGEAKDLRTGSRRTTWILEEKTEGTYQKYSGWQEAEDVRRGGGEEGRRGGREEMGAAVHLPNPPFVLPEQSRTERESSFCEIFHQKLEC